MKLVLAFVLLWTMAFAQVSENLPVHVIMHTEIGDVKIHLYGDVPKHKENFLKLCKSGHYDGMEFHRVIKDFMIQTGDPRTKPGSKATKEDVDYTLPAEIMPKYWHRRGVIAAARESDDINPDWKSSGGQFYVVTGRRFSPTKLDTLEMRVNKALKGRLMADFNKTKDGKFIYAQLEKAKAANQIEAIKKLQDIYDTKLREHLMKTRQQMPDFHYVSEQKGFYQKIGGAPWLDMQYTVFGEIIDGMEIIDQIGNAETDKDDHPTKSLHIVKMEVMK
ncbi:MAG: peptidylprolyl isomerase [Bacteroidia bacterium]